MKKRILLVAGAVLFAAAVSAIVYVNNERISMDELFNANVEALASSESGSGNCTFGVVIKRESSHALICRGNGSLCCVW